MDYTEIDATLIEHAQEGNKEALEKLCQASMQTVYFVALKILKNESDAEDIMAETMLTVIEKLKTLDEPKAYVSWINRITVNKCKNYLAKNKPIYLGDDEQEVFDNAELDNYNEEFLPEEFVLSQEKKKILMEIIREKTTYAEMMSIIMFYYNDDSIKTIAEEMGCAEITVKTRLASARKKIKSGIEEKFGKGVTLLTATFVLGRLLKAEAAELALSEKVMAETMAATVAKTAVVTGTSAAVKGVISGKAITGIIVGLVVTAGVATAVVSGDKQKDAVNTQNSPDSVVQVTENEEVHNSNNDMQQYIDNGMTHENVDVQDENTSDLQPESLEVEESVGSDEEINTEVPIEINTEIDIEVDTEIASDGNSDIESAKTADTQSMNTETVTTETVNREMVTTESDNMEAEVLPLEVDIGGVMYSTSLTALDLNSMELGDEDIVNLKYMVNLNTLNLGHNNIGDISPLASLINLTNLDLQDNQIADLSSLAGLVNMECLTISDNNISDISVFSGMSNLNTLIMRNIPVSDISPIAVLADRLDWLNISNTKVKDISPVVNLTNLAMLDISYCEISDIAELTNLENLSMFYASYTMIADIESLKSLTKLRMLGLSGSMVTEEQVAELRSILKDANIF